MRRVRAVAPAGRRRRSARRRASRRSSRLGRTAPQPTQRRCGARRLRRRLPCGCVFALRRPRPARRPRPRRAARRRLVVVRGCGLGGGSLGGSGLLGRCGFGLRHDRRDLVVRRRRVREQRELLVGQRRDDDDGVRREARAAPGGRPGRSSPSPAARRWGSAGRWTARPGSARRPAARSSPLSGASVANSVSDLMSTRQPVSRAASRAFWPSRPIASESWSSGTITVAWRLASSTMTSRTRAGDSALATKRAGSSL